MTESYPHRYNPGAEHEWLTQGVGIWDVECSYYFQPGEDPIRASGMDRVEMIGPYWRRGNFEADLLGTPIVGCVTLGFDPIKARFVETWTDSSNPFLYTYEGELDSESNQLVLEGLNLDPATGKPARYRSVEFLANADERTLDLFVAATDGREMRVLTYSYTRQL